MHPADFLFLLLCSIPEREAGGIIEDSREGLSREGNLGLVFGECTNRVRKTCEVRGIQPSPINKLVAGTLFPHPHPLLSASHLRCLSIICGWRAK